MRSPLIPLACLFLALGFVGCGPSGGGGGGGGAAPPAGGGSGTGGSGTGASGTGGSETAGGGETGGGATGETPAPATGGGEAVAGGWGTLRGRFVFGGDPPELPPANVTGDDAAYCSTHMPKVEKLVVNKENKGVRDVVVTLNPERGQTVEVHESYNETADDFVTLANEHCIFVPHVVLVRTSQTLKVLNPDEVGHNTKIDTTASPGFNSIIPAGQEIDVPKFKGEERLPANVSCSIHPWMAAKLVVKDHPYMAVSDADGNFEIANLPTGKWSFQVWQEAAGYVVKVLRDNKEESWARGRVDLTIQPGENDLGEITIPAASFKP